MTAPSFPLVGGQTQTAPTGAVTLALTLEEDPDNPTVGDLHLLNGQIHFWDGDKAKIQKVSVLLKFIKGEWFLNTEEGIPYFTQVLVHHPNSRTIVALFRKALLLTPGAIAADVTLDINRAERTARVNFTLKFEDGTELKSSDFGPFIVPVPS